MKKNLLILLTVFVFALLLHPTVTHADEFCGKWRGGWLSCTTGHKGKLNAQFRRIDSTHVRAKFSGTFAKVIPFCYRPVLDIVHEEPGLVVLQGTKRIPLGGNFHYNATVTDGHFSATYRSRRDHGVWQMSR